MSLVQCHECGRQISNSARACPGCGAAPRAPAGTGGKVAAALVVGLLGFGWAALWWAGDIAGYHRAERLGAGYNADPAAIIGLIGFVLGLLMLFLARSIHRKGRTAAR